MTRTTGLTILSDTSLERPIGGRREMDPGPASDRQDQSSVPSALRHTCGHHGRQTPDRTGLTGLALAGLTMLGAIWLPTAASANGTQGPQTASARPVLIELEVRGELFAAATAGAAAIRRPIALDARFEFLEQAAADAMPADVTRRYRTAQAVIEVDGQRVEQRLAADARDILVRLEGTTPQPYVDGSFLSRDEADLLDIPFDPLLIDELRPIGPVAIGDSWKLAGDLVAGLLAIDTVQSGGLEASLLEVADGAARLALRGTVTGAIDGVSTRLEVTGTATASASASDDGGWRIDGPITTVEATLSERREAGWVAPGFDVEATVAVKLGAAETAETETRPLDRAGDGMRDAADSLAAAATDRPLGQGRPGMVWHRHRQGRYSAVLDARWRVVEDGPEGLVMRLIDRGALLAQCSILPLPRAAADSAPTEEIVRDDVRRSLADQFGLIAESAAETRSDGTRLVRVVAEGSADGRPFRWIHYVLTAGNGHRVAVTFMLEPALVDRFAAADRELVAGLTALPDAPPRQAAARAATAR